MEKLQVNCVSSNHHFGNGNEHAIVILNFAELLRDHSE